MSHKINHANIKDWAANYDGPLFDGILCDPPYELGFMGKSWDSSGIAFDTEMWADIFKLIKPGGHLLAFSGSRTYHRMAVAIEDAGFEIRDMIEWVYGSGFPKSLNIGKQINKQEGVEFDELPASGVGFMKADSEDWNVTKNQLIQKGESSENAKKWEGYGTALKPAHEPCVLARKPLEGTVANNVLKHGTGGLNIDGTRVGTEDRENIQAGFIRRGRTDEEVFGGVDKNKPTGTTTVTGRFPANLIHDGSDEVEAVFPNESSRFFYTAKASKSERNAGLEGFEERTTQGMRENAGPALVGEDRVRTQTANYHPTVKPLSLTKYLATLIKPPTGGRLLVPFSGSGSEMIGALQAGWEYVEGVELTEEYIPIAEARIAHWMRKLEIKQMELL